MCGCSTSSYCQVGGDIGRHKGLFLNWDNNYACLHIWQGSAFHFGTSAFASLLHPWFVWSRGSFELLKSSKAKNIYNKTNLRCSQYRWLWWLEVINTLNEVYEVACNKLLRSFGRNGHNALKNRWKHFHDYLKVLLDFLWLKLIYVFR